MLSPSILIDLLIQEELFMQANKRVELSRVRKDEQDILCIDRVMEGKRTQWKFAHHKSTERIMCMWLSLFRFSFVATDDLSLHMLSCPLRRLYFHQNRKCSRFIRKGSVSWQIYFYSLPHPIIDGSHESGKLPDTSAASHFPLFI